MAGPQTKELGDREHRAISNGVYLLIPYRQYRSVLSLASPTAFVCHCIFSGASAPPRYARTSTVEQRAGFEAQMRELAAAGCEKTFQEQVSSVANRIQLHTALEFVREGDILVVTKLDRLARSVQDLMAILQTLESKRVGVRILNLGMDTHTPTGKLMVTMLGAVAQFEREMMLERQREGIAKAKSE